MANKIIQTRIKNRFDELSNWQKTGVELLPGEIALASVLTEQTDEATGKVVHVPAILMKVGDYKRDAQGGYITDADGNKTVESFTNLPWLSAKAADVYGWAKKATAADVDINVGTGTGAKSTTLGGLFNEVLDNKADIAEINEVLAELNGENGEDGSIADRITAAIEALVHTNKGPADGSNLIVKTVTQTDGKVTVTYGSITNDELPNDISASKIIVDDKSTTLVAKLGALDEAIAAIPENFSVTPPGSGVVKSVSYDNKYNFTITYDTVNTSEITDAAITTNKIADLTVTTGKIANKAVTDDKIESVVASKVIVDSNQNTALPDKLDAIDLEISGIKEAIAGGVHFRGTVTAEPDESTTTVNSVPVAAGDVVIYDGKEYICKAVADDKPSWEQLGDVTRIGALETAIESLDVEDENNVAATNMFVSQVTQENGKISVTYTQPTAANISYGTSSTVDAELDDHAGRLSSVEEQLDGVTKVTTSITNAINALDVAEPTASGDSTSFIATAKQEDGKIVVTKANLPTASTSTAGIVQLSNDHDSSSETLAATPKAVQAAYAIGDEARGRVANVESDYVRFANGKLYVGKDGADIIIFDCGGAL